MSLDSLTTRRAFLGAGALLTAGALVPRAARASAAPDATLAAILNRPLAAIALNHAVCRCLHCEAVRAVPLVCAGCGYTGEPVAVPCECRREWEQSVELFEDLLAGREVMRVDGKPLSRRRIKQHLRAARRALAADVQCAPPNVRCAHTSAFCPVCGDTDRGDGTEAFRLNDGPAHAAAIVRDVRAHLTTRGLLAAGPVAVAVVAAPRPSVAIRQRMVHGSDSTARPERELSASFATPLVGGRCEVRVSENHDPDFYPGQAFVSIYHDDAPGDRALSTVMTPGELDQLIAHLSAVRDRAKAIGMF